MSDNDRAMLKAVYLEWKAKGRKPTIQQLSDHSFDLVGRHYDPRVLRDWVVRDHWVTSLYEVDVSDPDIKEMSALARTAFELTMKSDKVKDIANYARSFAAVVNQFPEALLVDYQDAVGEIKDTIFQTLESAPDDLTPALYTGLVAIWAQLRRYLVMDVSMEEYLVDADAFLLGVDDGDDDG